MFCLKTATVAATASALIVLPAAAQASLRSCAVEATNTVTISSARDMSCATASRELQRYRGDITTTFSTPGRFACGRVSGGRLAGQWRCTLGHKAFRFEFRD